MVVDMGVSPRQLFDPDVLGEGRRQAPHLHAQGLNDTGLGLLLIAPVEYQLLALERGQQFSAQLFHLGLFGPGQHRLGFGQDVEQRQLFLGQAQILAAPPLSRQFAGELLQLLKERLDVLAARVSGIYKNLKLPCNYCDI